FEHDGHGGVVREVLSDGSVFTLFESAGRRYTDSFPTRRSADLQEVRIVYTDGGDVWTLADGTRIEHDVHGGVVREVFPGGQTATSCETSGRKFTDALPGDGGVSAQEARIVYTDGGDVWTLADGT